MIIKNVSLETVCGITSKLPENIHPEVAFAGKSNVGKSSLINGLMNRKSLARTSAQPGKTQTINYYNVNDEIYFVDLPGYGYAQANENVKAQWGKMIEDYLHKSKQLKLVFLLIDIRHAPSENDRIMYDWIRRNGYDPIIIATKLDYNSKRDQLHLVHIIQQIFQIIRCNHSQYQSISNCYKKEILNQRQTNIVTPVVLAYWKILSAFLFLIYSKPVHYLYFFFVYHKWLLMRFF